MSKDFFDFMRLPRLVSLHLSERVAQNGRLENIQVCRGIGVLDYGAIDEVCPPSFQESSAQHDEQ